MVSALAEQGARSKKHEYLVFWHLRAKVARMTPSGDQNSDDVEATKQQPLLSAVINSPSKVWGSVQQLFRLPAQNRVEQVGANSTDSPAQTRADPEWFDTYFGCWNSRRPEVPSPHRSSSPTSTSPTRRLSFDKLRADLVAPLLSLDSADSIRSALSDGASSLEGDMHRGDSYRLDSPSIEALLSIRRRNTMPPMTELHLLFGDGSSGHPT